MDTIRLALVGCGNIAQLNAPGYLQHPHCEVVALCDAVAERAATRARQWGISPKIYTDYAQVLDDPMDWRESFDGAAQDFIESLRQGRQPRQDARTAKKILQIALAMYEASALQRPVDPESIG